CRPGLCSIPNVAEISVSAHSVASTGRPAVSLEHEEVVACPDHADSRHEQCCDRLEVGRRERRDPLFRSSGRRRRGDRARPRADLPGATSEHRSPLCVAEPDVRRAGPGLYALRDRPSDATRDAVEYRRDAFGGSRHRAAPRTGSPDRRLSRREPSTPRFDVERAAGSGSLPGRAYAAGGGLRRERPRAASHAGRDLLRAANERPESVQPDAARETKLSAGTAGPSRPPAVSGRRASARDAIDPDEVLQALTTAVVVLDDGLEIVYFNPAAENLLGISVRQAVGRPLRDVILPADELENLCSRALDSGLTFGIRELTVKAGDRELILDCRASPLDAENGLLLELVDTERDRRIRRELDLQAKQRLSRRIISQLAHEVKNPLGGLRGAAQLLERQLPAPELKVYTQVIIDEADRLVALVDGILKGGRPRP